MGTLLHDEVHRDSAYFQAVYNTPHLLHSLSVLLERLFAGERLSSLETAEVFSLMLQGMVPDSMIVAILVIMRMRGEEQVELTGAVKAMRVLMQKVPNVPKMTIDVCGTGGDGQKTRNISTAVSFVLAGMGVPVAKHGNRALSSQSGAIDVLHALGIPACEDIAQLSRQIWDNHIAFLSAPFHHKGLGHISHIRKELGVRTIFNLLGPLCNPAGVTRQLIGVYDPKWLLPFARTLHDLGSENVVVVSGLAENGAYTDELTLAGLNSMAVVGQGKIMELAFTAEDLGLPSIPLSAIAGGNSKENATALEGVLQGRKGAYREIVLLNAAFALHVAGKVNLIKDGKIDRKYFSDAISECAKAIDQGKAFNVLNSLRRQGQKSTV